MPIFLKVDGIDGVSTAAHNSGGFRRVGGGTVLLTNSNTYGGINALMGDGSVRFFRDSINQASGHKFTLSRHYDGVSVAAGYLVSDAPVDAIEVSRIFVPNSPFGVIDSRDAGAVRRAGITPDGMVVILRKSGGVRVSIPRAASEAARRMKCSNNLKQLGVTLHGRIPAAELFINDNGNPRGVTLRLENVAFSRVTDDPASGSAGQSRVTPLGRITSVPVDPSDPASSSANQYSLNFSKITYKY